MNKILTSYVVDPSIEQPWTVQSLDFIQSSYKIMFSSIVATIAESAYSAGTKMCLYGGRKTFNGGSSYSFQPAFFYVANEIIPFFGVTCNISNTPILTISQTYTPGPDPLVFSDGIPRNVHMGRYITIADGAPGSGDADYSALTFVQVAVDKWHTVGSGGEPAYQNSWAIDAVGGAAGRFRKEGNYVVLSGLIAGGANGTIAFTLPVGYQPIHGAVFPSIKNDAGTMYSREIVIGNGTIDGLAAGEVYISWAGSTGDVSLEGVRFPLD